MFHLCPDGFLPGHVHDRVKTDQTVKTEWPHHTREIITVDCGEQLDDQESPKAFN